MKYICVECGNSSGDWIYRKCTREYKGDGYCFELEVEVPFCKECGAAIYDKRIEEEIREKANSIIREQTGIITKEEILEIIAYYGVSQKYLSKTLGWGEVTLPRYIKGNYSPSAENSNKLKMIRNPYILLNIVEERPDEKDLSLRKKLLKNINKRIVGIENERGNLFKAADWFLNNSTEEDIITHLALQKALYFVQAWNYIFNGYWIFNEDCEAWVHGAVYRNIYDEFKAFNYSRLPELDTVSSLKEEEIEVLRFVKENYLDVYSAKTLERICHLEEPYIYSRASLDENEKSNRLIFKDVIAGYYKHISEEYDISIEKKSNVSRYLNDLLFKG